MVKRGNRALVVCHSLWQRVLSLWVVSSVFVKQLVRCIRSGLVNVHKRVKLSKKKKLPNDSSQQICQQALFAGQFLAGMEDAVVKSK